MNHRNDDTLPRRNRPDRGTLSKPERPVTPTRRPASETPAFKSASPQPEPPVTQPPHNLAQTRKEFGFDDIPIDEDDMEHVRFRDIIRAWVKQAIKHSPLEGKLKSSSRLKELKNDLKWAVQADLDEPVKPNPPEEPTPPPNVVADKTPMTKPSVQPVDSTSKTIDININFGSLPKLPPIHKSTKIQMLVTKIRAIKWTRKRIIVVGVVVVVIVGAVIAVRVYPEITGKKSVSSTARKSEAIKAPTYPTLLPDNKSIDTLGGWHRVSPPDREPVFAYADKIDDIQINVSQQPIPDDLKSDKDKKIAELAKGFNATEEIKAGDTTFYLGTSSKGPQSAIVVKNNTLILMKSHAKISEDAWVAYIDSLK